MTWKGAPAPRHCTSWFCQTHAFHRHSWDIWRRQLVLVLRRLKSRTSHYLLASRKLELVLRANLSFKRGSFRGTAPPLPPTHPHVHSRRSCLPSWLRSTVQGSPDWGAGNQVRLSSCVVFYTSTHRPKSMICLKYQSSKMILKTSLSYRRSKNSSETICLLHLRHHRQSSGDLNTELKTWYEASQEWLNL